MRYGSIKPSDSIINTGEEMGEVDEELVNEFLVEMGVHKQHLWVFQQEWSEHSYELVNMLMVTMRAMERNIHNSITGGIDHE